MERSTFAICRPVWTPAIAWPLTTVGTYQVADALSATEAASKGQGSVPIAVGGGGVGFYGQEQPHERVRRVPGRRLPGGGLRPDSGRSPASRRVGPGYPGPQELRLRPRAAAVSPAGLESAATRLGQPIYWAGPETDATYELSQTSEGRVFVRVPAAWRCSWRYEAVPNDRHLPFDLCVRGHPRSGEEPRTLRRSSSTTAESLCTTRRVARASTSPIRTSNYQIEVFDPTPGNAPELVRSGTIVAVG